MTSQTLVIRGGELVDRSGRRFVDIAIDEGRIVDIGASLDVSGGVLQIDASGCHVTPGFVDLHSHLREPGREEAETVETGSRGAALGGYTAVLAMPNTTPAIDSASVVREIQHLSLSALCTVLPVGAITKGRRGEQLSDMAEMAALGVRMFTDDGDAVADNGLMRRAMEYARGLGVGLAQHCEDPELSLGGAMHEGEWSSRLGLSGQPPEAEELMVMRDIALCRMTGTSIHFQHMSTAKSVQMIREAKAAGLPVTAEATTHHFTLTHESCAGYDPVYKVNPPLRTEIDVAGVREGLADGTIDAIATDHAPHTPESKELPFDEAPPGMLGLETAMALAMTELDLPVERVFELLSWKPAELAGLAGGHGGLVEVGRAANLCVIDPSVEWVVSGKSMASPSHNTPYEGRRLTGKVRHTIHEGELVVSDGLALR